MMFSSVCVPRIHYRNERNQNAGTENFVCIDEYIVKNNVLKKLIISYRQYTESYKHNQTYDQQPKTYSFGIDIRLLFLVF